MRKISTRFALSLVFGATILQMTPGWSADFIQSTDPKNTCSAIEVSGDIAIGDYDRLALLLKETNAIAPVRRLYLNSAGGNIFTTMAIAALIRNSAPEVETIVQSGQTCNSACVILLSVGSRHFISSDATVVIHQVFDPKTGERDADQTREMGKYLVSNGMSPETVQTFSSLSADEQLSITPSNAKQLGFGNLVYYGSTDPPATPQCSWEGFIVGKP